jgi:aspartate/methionine/tyrosine aminotransferase
MISSLRDLGIARNIDLIETRWVEEFFDKIDKNGPVIDLGIGEPDFGVPSEIINEAYRAMAEGKNRYTPTAGIHQLRELIAERYGSAWGADLNYQNVILTPGASNALFMAIASIVDEGDEVLIPAPSYPHYGAVVRMLGGKPIEVPTMLERGFDPEIEEINKRITGRTKLIIINTPTNPTGYVYNDRTMSDLADIAVEKDIYIISDEVYENYVYDGKFVSMNKFRSRLDKVVTVHSFSKTFGMTGWRLGFLIGNESLISNVSKLQTYINACPPSVAQYAALYALSSPFVAENIKLIINSYRKRRDLAYKLLRDKGFDVSLPRGAFYMFPRIPVKMDSYEFCRGLLRSEGVVTMPGRAFGEAGEGYFRMTFAVDPETLRVAVELIEKFVSSHNH